MTVAFTDLQDMQNHMRETIDQGMGEMKDEMKKLMAAGRCFKCYAKGHRASDDSCPRRGKPNERKPTVEELNA